MVAWKKTKWLHGKKLQANTKWLHKMVALRREREREGESEREGGGQGFGEAGRARLGTNVPLVSRLWTVDRVVANRVA